MVERVERSTEVKERNKCVLSSISRFTFESIPSNKSLTDFDLFRVCITLLYTSSCVGKGKKTYCPETLFLQKPKQV